MSAWSERTKREKRLVIAFGVVVLLAGMKLVAGAAGSEPEPQPNAAPPAQPVTQEPAVDAPAVDAPPANEEPGKVKHPTGPGSKRDPFKPLIDAAALSAGDAPSDDQPAGPQTIKVDLVDIFIDKGKLIAVVDVDEERFRGQVGKVVGEKVEIVELSDRCGVFEAGHETFGLCVGQSVERTI